MLKTIGGILVFAGILLMAGSGGDCDGACMEQANTITEMLMIAGLGLTMAAIGAILINVAYKGQ